jgi:arylsulfatase A-like enzyme
VGAVLDRVADLGIGRQTLVLFSSDNGPHREGGFDPTFFASAGPLRGIKRDLYEGGVRVPLIARWPGRIAPGVTDYPVAFWDLLPTCCDLVGALAPHQTDGVSLLVGLFTGFPVDSPTSRPPLYWEFQERGFQQAVRIGAWKAVRLRAGEPWELFNLALDPGESTDVANQNSGIVREVESYAAGARTESEHWPVARQGR